MGKHCRGPGAGQLEGKGQLQGKGTEKEGTEVSLSSCLSLVVRLLGQGERSGFCSSFKLNHSYCESQILKEPKDCLCSVF